jgi:uncharacterized protein YkwD
MRLLSLLKHIFIPHIGNDYKPHFFREHVVLSLSLTALFLLLISFTSYTVIRTTKFGSSVVASVLIDLTNKNRTVKNLPPLLYNQKLETAATLKGQDMVNKQYFAHYSPDGTTPWHFMTIAGYPFSFAGENLALNFKNSYEVENAWINSKEHRDNIFNPHYQDIGIATVQGLHEGTPVLFVVQMFGKGTVETETKEPKNSRVWYYPLLFNTTHYIDILYRFLIVIIVVSLFLMIFIEVKKQHYLHILYGILLLLVVVICTLINTSIS